MGGLCSPDSVDPNTEPNTDTTQRRQNGKQKGKNGYETEQSATDTAAINADMLDDLSFDNSVTDASDGDYGGGPGLNKNVSLTEPSMPDHSVNTSRSGLKEIQKEVGIVEDYKNGKKETKKKAGFRIEITDVDKGKTNNGSYTPINGDESGSNKEEEERDLIKEKRNQKVDSTLGGVIVWKKVADFSALLPRDVKLKLWNGVFKTESDYNQPEMKRISKVLRTFVMLQLTREYKKTNETVPTDLKQQLPGAVKEPSKFIASFLKKDEKFIDQALLTIYDTICEKFKTDDDSKKAKYAKKAKMTQENYSELVREDLKREFNENDFLKTAFLQYMLYAYQIKLDTDNAKAKK